MAISSTAQKLSLINMGQPYFRTLPEEVTSTGAKLHLVDLYAFDTGAATLSLPTSNPLVSAVILGCTTDKPSGSIFAVVDLAVNIAAITAAQVIAGDNNGDVPAIGSDNAFITDTTPSVVVTGLTAATLYSFALAQDTGSESNVVTGTFTTNAAGAGDDPRSVIQNIIQSIIERV